jgi:methionyl-tRNA formyltransferase
MRLVFMGTPDFSVPGARRAGGGGARDRLRLLPAAAPAGRGKKDRPSPGAGARRGAGPARAPPGQPEGPRRRRSSPRWGGCRRGRGLWPDPAAGGAGCAAARLPEHPRLLLPRWRGAAPIHRAIMAGDAETGVCIMQMEAGLDTGPVLLRERCRSGRRRRRATCTTGCPRWARLIVEALDGSTTLTPEPQPEDGVTYAEKIDKAEARIDWTATPRRSTAPSGACRPFPGRGWR